MTPSSRQARPPATGRIRGGIVIRRSTGRRLSFRTAGIALASALLLPLAVSSAGAQPGPAPAELPEQEPGVTLRTFQLPQYPGAVCELEEGTTPNVDRSEERRVGRGER